MFYYAVLFISFFLIALILRIYRFVFYALAQNSVALVNELISETEDDEKIELIQKKTNRLVVSLLKMLLYVVVSFIVGGIPIAVYCLLTNTGFNDLVFSSFYAIVIISAGATIAFIIPFGKKKGLEYSELSQLLHRMALDNYNISNKLFKKETKKIKKYKLQRREDFVIISGLARAGTTSLMNDLSKIDKFVSLNYANMPFLMCPNIWAKFYKPKNNEVKERSHKDGIMIGLNSNEALEEYFFKVKANNSYIENAKLSEYKISEKDYADYLDYQSILKLDNEKIYLAKNNNFILRYNSVRELNENFLMVILYRDPLTHAASLMEKHLYYKNLQNDDPFVLEYMNWLGHHEFGLNQKPFVFNNSDDFFNADKETMEFWLKSWINYYSYVLTSDHPKTILVNYDSYCENPEKIIKTILDKTGITVNLPKYQPFKNTRKNNFDLPGDLYKRALEIYDELNKR